MLRGLSILALVWASSTLCVACYDVHFSSEPDTPIASGEDAAGSGAGGMSGPRFRQRQSEPPPERPTFDRPDLPPVQCDLEPTPDCVASFPRVMIVMDASSSMLAGREPGRNSWDKARFALAGNPSAPNPGDPGFVQPAFARELEVRGNVVTMEDVFHLGLITFNSPDAQQLVLQYAPCASDNIRWAMDPYVSCEQPGCRDPYSGQPSWTFKNSDADRDPPFVHTTVSYMPPCNPDDRMSCVGNMYNTFTAEGMRFAWQNITSYRDASAGSDLDSATRFANILITDGVTSPDSPPEGVLQAMADQGIPTYVIGLEPRGIAGDPEAALERFDVYAQAGGTQLATLIEADEVEIADAFAQTVTRIIDEIGTDPCCQPYDCSEDPEPEAP